MSVHTPGPWTIHRDSWGIEIHASSGDPRTYLGIAEGVGGKRRQRPDGTWDDSEVQANARLIAAAPDLLEALRVAYRHIDPNGLRRSHGKDIALIDAAIAKATGEQP